MNETMRHLRDLLQAQLCYQLFITPIRLPLPKEYRHFARSACDYLEKTRDRIMHFYTPRHYVIHHIPQNKHPQAKKILITHGWMSRGAYMARLIRMLHQEGFDVYALDFPAHGEAKGFQLTWYEAVAILRQIINQLGPFHAAIGHSFGGAMLLNTLNLASQYPEWQIKSEPEHMVLLSTPSRMQTPVRRLSRQLNLSAHAYTLLRQMFEEQTPVDIKSLDVRHYKSPAKTPFLCIHGEDDDAIHPKESKIFCNFYPHASLILLPDVDHVNILMDKRVDDAVCNFVID